MLGCNRYLDALQLKAVGDMMPLRHDACCLRPSPVCVQMTVLTLERGEWMKIVRDAVDATTLRPALELLLNNLTSESLQVSNAVQRKLLFLSVSVSSGQNSCGFLVSCVCVCRVSRDSFLFVCTINLRMEWDSEMRTWRL